jgi:hypothetical protein
MSRTEEDILSRVDVPIMRNTTLSTYPAYSELCDTFRPRLGSARRTDKTLKLTETPIFRTRKSPSQERHFLPGASAGMPVPEER